jgi:hypothetical protein
MALTRLQNIISSVEGRIIYVNPDDFDATDAIDNKGNSPIRPFKSIARAVLEVARYSYVSAGSADDKFDQFTILLYPGDHIVDNRPGNYPYALSGQNYVPSITPFSASPIIGEYGWSNVTKQYADLYKITNSSRGGLIIPRGVSIIGLDLRKTKIRPKYIPLGGSNTAAEELIINYTADPATPNTIEITTVSGGDAGDINDLFIGSIFEKGDFDGTTARIEPGTRITSIDCNISGGIKVNLSKPHNYTAVTSPSGVTVRIPFEDDNSRTALFRITGGCYFWQFTILDGDTNGVYTTGTVEPQTTWSGTVDPQISHTKLTVFEFAALHELFSFYRKVSDAISIINCEKIEPKIQENRIVGPLADSVSITKLVRNRNVVTVSLSEELNITAGNFISITGVGNFITGSSNTNPFYSGEKKVSSVNNRSEFTFVLDAADVSTLNQFESGSDEDGDENGVQITYTPNATAKVEIEIDTVESASPYIFNVSLRSTYGTCGMHADGSRATGFKSMVVAQYTGISLQKDDGAFLKYDSGTNTYINDGQSLYHKDIDAVYNPLQRSYHVKASNRAVIQAVSVFAVGFADHFIAEDGGDMSITNSNSNFGSNALRSIGYSDVAFKKDSLGRVTHIIPPRNVESGLSNVYWESIDTVLTTQFNNRIYISDRTEFIEITSGGSLFVSTTLPIQDPTGANLTLNVTLGAGGVITAVTFLNDDYGTFQPGDVVHVVNPDNINGLPLEFTIGGTLTTFVAGRFELGSRDLNKDGTATFDNIYVPLYANGATSTSEQFARILPAVNANIFEYDFTNNNWYVNVNPAANAIYTSVSTNTTKYGTGKIESTPTAYIKRINDERIDDEKIYRLRYVTKRSADGTLPSYPQAGYVIQPKKGAGIPGVGDRFTDGANLLLANKYFLAEETVARYLDANGGFTITGGNQRCIDDLIDIIEAVAYNLRYGGNSEVYTASSFYVSTGNLPETERTATNDMLQVYLKPMVEKVIDNTNVTGTVLNTNETQVKISNQPQLVIVPGGCTNVRDAAYTLIDIVRTAVGTDNTPGTLPAQQTQPSSTYQRINGHEYNDVYYIYEVEEVVPYSFNPATGVETEGVYYLTVLKGSIPVSTGILPGNTFKFSQSIDTLYPDIDIDNVVSDPIIAKSVADPVLIGNVKTTNGLSNAVNDPVDPSYSITKESLAYFFDEYLNNELEWLWNGKETLSSNVVHRVNLNNLDGTHQEILVNLASTSGDGEVRKVPINPTREGDSFEVELRRPSTIRSGNHTFEYVGFGPGNYSTGFPIRQTKVLSTDEQKYSQSLKEQGGIAFYSGLNSNGDLYIGNTVINAVTGKTTENEINELNSLTVKDNITVLGGAGNRITSNFQGPVSFRNELAGEGDNFFANVQLRNQDGIISKILNADTTPVSGGAGDFIFNTVPEEGGYFGWSYTDGNEWRPAGLVGTEKIHAYKSGSKYVFNVGQNQIDITNNTTVNINYDIDVTSNQRVGNHIDIGTGATAAITSNTASKETRLYIEQSWTDPGVTYKPIEIKLTNDSGDGKMIDMLKADGTSVFSVDKQGNVAIQPGSSYGISDRAFNTFLTVAGASNTGNQEISIQTLIPATTVTVPSYVGSSASTNLNYSYGFRTSTDLGSYRFYGAPADLDNFNTRSMLVFINGVLQTPYVNFYFDGTRLYFNTQPLLGSKIEVRCLAN